VVITYLWFLLLNFIIEVMSCFMEDFMPKCASDNRLVAYSQYLLNNYISNASTFLPKSWAETSTSLTRTTNVCESLHSDFNQSFIKNSPLIFLWVQNLLNYRYLQTSVYCKMSSAKEPKTPRNIIDSRQIRNKIRSKLHSQFTGTRLDLILSNFSIFFIQNNFFCTFYVMVF